jgi:hypothetical protein
MAAAALATPVAALPAAAEPADPHVAWLSEMEKVMAECDSALEALETVEERIAFDAEDGPGTRMFRREFELRTAILSTPARTQAGALVQLRLLVDDMLISCPEEDEMVPAHRNWLAAARNAVAFLESQA